jgi:hypothetical protein
LQTQPRQLARAVRQDVDADPDRAQLGHGVEDAAGDARLVQRERESQAANAGTHDQGVGVVSHRHRRH